MVFMCLFVLGGGGGSFFLLLLGESGGAPVNWQEMYEALHRTVLLLLYIVCTAQVRSSVTAYCVYSTGQYFHYCILN